MVLFAKMLINKWTIWYWW